MNFSPPIRPPRFTALFLGAGLGVLLLAGAGCQGVPLPGKNGTHYLIIGVGLVHCPTNDRNAVLVTRTQALGLSFNTDPAAKFALGYAAGTVVAVPANADDVRVEVSLWPRGVLNIHPESSVLLTNQPSQK